MITEPLVFVDTETTSLRPDRRVWEVAAIRRDPDGFERLASWIVGDVDLAGADPASLDVGRFYDRHPSYANTPESYSIIARDEENIARSIEEITRGAHLVGVNPAFDAQGLDALLRRHGRIPAWHYHLIDVSAIAVGWLTDNGAAPSIPWHSYGLSASCGVEPPAEGERHTALGDARWAMRWFDRVMSR